MMQTIDWLEAFFLSTDLWGLFGVIAVVSVSYVLIKKNKGLGLFYLILEGIMTYQYYELAKTTPFYYWDCYILVLGIITCAALSSR